MNFSSRLLESAVAEFAQLPGIGPKTALRLVLHLIKQDEKDVSRFGNTLLRLKSEITYCKTCGNLSDQPVCAICTDPGRNHSLLCVVEDTRDVMAIENTDQYHGVYHVLGGLISPMDGIGPSDLNVESLIERTRAGGFEEIILAVSATMEGDTTLFYIFKKLKQFEVKFSTIAKGIAFGGELEYADEVTLGRSIVLRVPYENQHA